MPERVFLYGALPDRKDDRDFKSRTILVTEIPEPKKYDVWRDTIIYDQNGYPRCATYSFGAVKSDQEHLEHPGLRLYFDADKLYERVKQLDGDPREGAEPRMVCKVAQKEGMALKLEPNSCPLAFMKPKPTPVPVQTSEEMLKNKIEAYFRIERDATDSQIRQILLQFGSIYLASLWYDPWNVMRGTFPKPTGKPNVRHAYKLMGYDMDLGWLMANNWGKTLWGVAGRAYMAFQMFRDYVLKEGDCWKTVDHLGEVRT